MALAQGEPSTKPDTKSESLDGWDEDSDSGGDWITPDNIKEKLYSAEDMQTKEQEDQIGVYLMTSDFAM